MSLLSSHRTPPPVLLPGRSAFTLTKRTCRFDSGLATDSLILRNFFLQVSAKAVAEKLNYNMSVPAAAPVENNSSGSPAEEQTSGGLAYQNTPPQSPSVSAANTPPKYKSSSIAIKLTYNQPQSSQDKPNEPEPGKQFSQVLSVPNPLDRSTLTHSRSASSLTEVEVVKVGQPATTGTYRAAF